MTAFPYILIRSKDQQKIMTAAYCKFFFPEPYIALFEDYPSADTRVLVCRRAEEGRQYGYREMELCSVEPGGSRKQIGRYVTVCECRSEQEAVNRVQENVRGASALLAALAGDGDG